MESICVQTVSLDRVLHFAISHQWAEPSSRDPCPLLNVHRLSCSRATSKMCTCRAPVSQSLTLADVADSFWLPDCRRQCTLMCTNERRCQDAQPATSGSAVAPRVADTHSCWLRSAASRLNRTAELADIAMETVQRGPAPSPRSHPCTAGRAERRFLFLH